MCRKRRGRSGSGQSKGHKQPQMISQRHSGSAGDLRSTSTESDFNSADEAGRVGMSPQREGPSGFRFPKTKKLLMTEWMNEKVEHVIANDSPAPVTQTLTSLPYQYIRKSNSLASPSHSGSSPPTAGSGSLPSPVTTTSACSTPLLASNPLIPPNLDSGSAKKRWLRQAISEETDPKNWESAESRPDSPAVLSNGPDCVAPLKKRRLARASMSSEVSNTPPSTPISHLNAEEMDEKESSAVQSAGEINSGIASSSQSSEDDESEEDTTMDDSKASNEAEVTTKPDSPAVASDAKNEVESEVFSEPDRPCTPPAKEEDAGTTVTPSTPTKKTRWDQEVKTNGKTTTSSPVTSPNIREAVLREYVRNPANSKYIENCAHILSSVQQQQQPKETPVGSRSTNNNSVDSAPVNNLPQQLTPLPQSVLPSPQPVQSTSRPQQQQQNQISYQSNPIAHFAEKILKSSKNNKKTAPDADADPSSAQTSYPLIINQNGPGDPHQAPKRKVN